MYIFLAYISFSFRWLYFYSAVAWFFAFTALFLYARRQPWANEAFETRIFANMYSASKQLELYSREDEKAILCLKKAIKKVENALFYLERFEKELKGVNSAFVKGNLIEPLTKLENNIKERILPRIAIPKETPNMISVLRGLADMFGQTQRPLKIEDVSSKNEVLETYEKIKIEEKPKRLTLILTMKPVQALLSYLTSFVIVLALTWVHSIVTSTDIWSSLSSTTSFLAFLSIVATVGSVIYAVIRKS
jgi:hypothetical protein